MKLTMTSRQRVFAAIEFGRPDRVPFKLDVSPDAIADDDYACLMREVGNDFLHNAIGWYTEGMKMGKNVDEWGCTWLNLQEGSLGQVIEHPLTDISRLSCYKWPKPGEFDLSSAQEYAENRGDKYLLLGYISLFERMINLRGFENLLVDIGLEEDHFHEILDNVLNINMQLVERLLELNPDGVFMADDWGTQKALMISPAKWSKLFLPAYIRIIDLVRSAGKHVFFHSDGKVTDILPELASAGVNVFWVEFGVNTLDWLEQNLGGKAAFLSLQDTQIMEFGTVQDIDTFVREQISALGRFHGGFIAYPEQKPSQKNKVVMKAFIKYGSM